MTLSTLLAIDIGNSRANLGLFAGETLVAHEFYPSSVDYVEKICDIAETWRREPGVEAVILGSVVPRLGELIATLLEQRSGLRPVFVEGFKTRLLPLLVDRPESVGVDRVINCYAAIHLYGAPALVVSMGTATTFEAISKDGEYLGGAIAPGVRVSLEALTQRTALLPPAVWKKPDRLIGKNTLEHMESGIYYGAVSLIEGMTRRFREELGDSLLVIGTGGISQVIAEEGVFDRHDLELTLKGLRLIYAHQRHPS